MHRKAVSALVALALACGMSAGAPAVAGAEVKAGAASKRSDVRALQRKVGVAADGVFGPATERALKRWQRRHGLVADGIAGPQTRAAMGLGSGPILKRRHQQLPRPKPDAGRTHRPAGGAFELFSASSACPPTASSVPATEAAVKRWQRRHGLVADGVVGPQTRSAMGLGRGRSSSAAAAAPEAAAVAGGRLSRLIRAANRIATAPYRYGGGHGSYRDSGYDCSGSISYALHFAGLLRTPLDSSGFMSYGLPGKGRHVTIYAHPGHAYMVVDGRRFDTSARRETGSRWTSTHRSPAGYTVRHPPGL